VIGTPLEANPDWLWFLSDGARPCDDALERLLGAIEPAGHAPASVVAGLLIDEHGEPLADRLQAAPRIDAALAVLLVGPRLLAIRCAGFTHCLVARSAFRRHGLPDTGRFGPFAAEEWTARVLRRESGYLVPDSRVVVPTLARADRSDRGSHRLATLRMLPTGTWSRGDAARAVRRTLVGNARRREAGASV
jgi:hypothetical protein